MMSFYEQAIELYSKGEILKSLEIISESESFVQGTNFDLDFLEADIFLSLGEESESPEKKVIFLRSSLECYLRRDLYHSAYPMFKLAELIGSVSYYKKSLKIASSGLEQIASIPDVLDKNGVYRQEKEKLELLIENVKSTNLYLLRPRIIVDPKGNCEQEVTRMRNSDLVEVLRPYWKGSNDEIKRSFMKVSIQEFRLYVSMTFGKDGKEALEQVLAYARKKEKWKFWLCRSCPKRFSTSEECTSHLAQEHGAEFKPCSRNDMAQRVSEVWAGKVSAGVWKPVDAEAAVQMIKTDVKVFKYQDGCCKEWPLAEDEERSRVLNGIRSLLVSFCDHKILSESIRDRMMHAVVKRLGELEVSKQTLTDCRLLETLLGCGELNQIFDLLSGIQCNRNDGIDLVCSAVDSFCGGTRVREKIDFDSNFSFMLLDKRLLQGNVDGRFDEEGKISFTDPNVHCAKARAGGDAFMSWLAVYSSGDVRFKFPRNIKAHNLDIWGAALRAIQFTCRTLETKYAKKMQLLCDEGTKVLESVVKNKVAKIDSKILVIEKSRVDLLKNLTSLCVF